MRIHSQQTYTMCNKLFNAALRTAVYPGDWGSSPTVIRNLSSFFLNSSTLMPVRSQMFFGNTLKRLAPLTQKLPSRRVFILLQDVDSLGTLQNLPCLVDSRGWILLSSFDRFGTIFSMIFQA